MKDPLLLNKIAASVLTALFVMLMIDFAVDELILTDSKAHGDDHSEEAAFAYNIEVPELDASTAGAAEAAPKTAELILALLASADTASGEKIAKKCTACHTFTKDGTNRIGPNQWDIVARARGITQGFAYSESLLQSGGSWDYESLNQFLYNPKTYIPGTKMNFSGIKSAQDRADLILWLRGLSDSPVPLP